MKKALTILVFLTLTGAAFAEDIAGRPALAFLLPLTGSGADEGEWCKRGFQLAAEDSSGDLFNLIFEDTRGDPRTAVDAYRKVQALNHVPVIFTWGSGVGMALSPLVNRDKVIQFGVATATPSYSSKGDYTFRNFPPAEYEALLISKTLIEDLSAKTAAVLHIENDYGEGFAKAFTAIFKELGGTVPVTMSFRPGETDFRTLLARVRSLSPAAIFVSSYAKEGAVLLKQVREAGITLPIITPSAILGGSDFFSLAGAGAEGLLVSLQVLFSETAPNPRFMELKKRYETRFNEPLKPQHIMVARAYDAFQIIAPLVLKCSSNTDCIRDGLFRLNSYDGASGRVSFDENGDAMVDYRVYVVRNGELVPFNNRREQGRSGAPEPEPRAMRTPLRPSRGAKTNRGGGPDPFLLPKHFAQAAYNQLR